jgi:putative membrane protein
MKKILTDEDSRQLNALIATTEKHTNTQIVLALIQRSDSYAELPWKAFALGTAAAGSLIFLHDLIFYDWHPLMTVLPSVATILGLGVVFALLTLLLPDFARLFLSVHRAETEVRQYAESLFLSRELFATARRTGILLLVSLFERRVVIIPDKGLDNILTENLLHSIIGEMTAFLRKHAARKAFEAGMEKLAVIVGDRLTGTGKNELSDEIIEEKGV